MKKILLTIVVLLATAFSVSAQQTPPAGSIQESWSITYSYQDSHYGSLNDTEAMKVVFNESDVYFNFPNTVTGNTWMKGTRDGSVVTFEKGQLIGTANGTTYYFMGVVDGSTLCDIVFTYDEENKVFTLGNMYIAQNSSKTEVSVNGYFTSATITKTDAPDTPVGDDDTAVTPPAGVEQADYSFYAVFHAPQEADEELDETVKVAIDGTTVYLQIPNPVNGLAWIKGTIVGETVVFPIQYLGTSGGQKFYLTGRSENDVIGDIVFTYSESLMVCNDQWIQICDDKAGQNVYAYYSTTLVVKPGEDDPVVEAPADLQASPYVFTGNKRLNDEEGNYAGYTEVQRALKVGFYNNDTEVYIQGLCETLPEAWVKGTVEDDAFGDKKVTIKKGQCFGKYGLYPLYIGAATGNYISDLVFIYDTQTRAFTNDVGSYMVVYTNAGNNSQLIDMYMTAKLAPGIYSAIQPITVDSIANDDAWYTLQGVRVDKPGKGIFIYKGKKIKR